MGIGDNNDKAFIVTYSILNTKFYVIDIVNLLNKIEFVEKRVCHYPLKKIKELIMEGKFSITKNAQKTAIEQFGYGETEIINEVLKLQNSDFYKSMTSHNNHLLWHDVYKKESDNYKLYIKIQILNSNTLIISFKGDESL